MSDESAPLPVFKNFVFENIYGSGLNAAGEFGCLSGSPCNEISMKHVHLSASKGFTCENAYGNSQDVSPTSCLKRKLE